MTSFQIQVFLKAAELNSFSAAAKALYISQPAVSRYIIKLEHELDVILFERSGTPINLTKIGSDYYKLFKRHSEELQELRIQCKKPTLRIGTATTWDISSIYFPFMEQMKKLGLDFDIYVEYLDYDTLIAQLNNGALDFILTADFTLTHNKKFEQKRIAEVPVFLYFSKNHPLAQKENLKITDFYNEPFLINKNALKFPEMNKRMQETFSGFKFKETANDESIIRSVQYGLGVSVGDTWMKGLDKFHFIPTNTMTGVTMAWSNHNQNDALLQVLKHIDSLFNSWDYSIENCYIYK